MAHSYDIGLAAKMARASYDGRNHASIATALRKELDQDDVQALFLKGDILLIPGSNSVADYLKFNLRVLNIGGKKYRLNDEDTEQGASGTIWHQGFLRHAQVIFAWLERERLLPKYIIGHSLGAAATQILVRTYGVPGIGFAAPRPRRSQGPIKHSHLCLCINRDDDNVCNLPGSFHHMGKVHRARARTSVFGPDHSMPHYQRVIDEQQTGGHLGKRWPES
ncbi:hypothetical protein [uncultured Tateyamaria sp.]|uniref:hypothetical protein n=1 Tax=uncultured Tateyamaria sp. TaxID=455651 RepID=UPI002616114A|nr:hypothetical protein [uncultured Tateyamaria sp.]